MLHPIVIQILAQIPGGTGRGGTFRDVVRIIVDIISKGLVPIVIGATVIVFLFGIVKYILKSDSEAGRESGRKFIIYGLIGIVVVMSVWTIVAVFLRVIGVPVVIPQVR